jgi:acyl carrier protein
LDSDFFFGTVLFVAAPANAVLLDRSEVQTRVLQVLQSHSFVNSAKLGPHASLVHDLGLDELHLEQLTGALKNEFCVEVQPVRIVSPLTPLLFPSTCHASILFSAFFVCSGWFG